MTTLTRYIATTSWTELDGVSGVKGYFDLQNRSPTECWIYHGGDSAPTSSEANRNAMMISVDAKAIYSVDNAIEPEKIWVMAKDDIVPININKKDNSVKIQDQGKDSSRREGFNTVFGDQIIGTRIPSLSAQFQYGLASDAADIVETSTGSVDIVESVLTISSGVASDGAAEVESTGTIRYIPGHEIFCNFTAYFSEPTTAIQHAGLHDSQNGFYIGYDGTDEQFSFFRVRAGVIEDKKPIDMLDGDLDPTKMNVYRISYGYLGVANITLARLNSDNSWSEIAIIPYAGTSRLTHTTQTFLPLRADVDNNGNTTDTVVGIGSVEAGIVDGGGVDVNGRYFAAKTGTVTIGSGTETILGVFRNKDTYNSIENRVKSMLLFISSACEGNKTVEFKIIKNPTFTNAPTWNDINANSVIEISTDATINVATGELMLDWNLGKSDSLVINTKDLSLSLLPSDYVAFTALSSGASEVNAGVRYEDLF